MSDIAYKLTLRRKIQHRLTGELPDFARAFHLKFKLVNLLFGVLPLFVSGGIRSRLYHWAGFKLIEPGVFIAGNLKLVADPKETNFYRNLSIGAGSVIGYNVMIDLDAEVRLGKNVSLGPSVRIFTASHDMGPATKRCITKLIGKPVTIEDGCWIGLGAIILPGVTIGHGSIIAAGTVVTRTVPPDSLVEGDPARIVQKLPWGNR